MSSLTSEQVQGLELKRAALRMDLQDKDVSDTDKTYAEISVAKINEQLQAQEKIDRLQNSLQQKLDVVLGHMSQIKDVRLLWYWEIVSHDITYPSTQEDTLRKRAWSSVVSFGRDEAALDLRMPLELEESLRALWKEDESAAQEGFVSLFTYSPDLLTVTVRVEKPWAYGYSKGPVTHEQRRSVDIDNEHTLDRKLSAYTYGRRQQIIKEIAQEMVSPVASSANIDEIASQLGVRKEQVQQLSDAIKEVDLENISRFKLDEIFSRLMDVRYYFARNYGKAKETLGITDLPEQGDHHGDISDWTYDIVEQLISNKVKSIT